MLRRLSSWWATRSLLIGAVSVGLDLATGGTILWFGGPTRVAAMGGTTVGSTWTYFANRHLAFRDHEEPVAKSGLKFFVMQAVMSVLHGQVVVWLRDGYGIPYVFAKLMADVMVVTVPQLLLMRYVIFPQKKQQSGEP